MKHYHLGRLLLLNYVATTNTVRRRAVATVRASTAITYRCAPLTMCSSGFWCPTTWQRWVVPVLPLIAISLWFGIPFLSLSTHPQVRQLCQEWFPIDYPLSWYEDITSSTRFFALAAVYNLAIIGLIVAEIKPYRNVNKEVIANMSDSDELYTRLSGFPMQDKGILPDSMGRTADVGYILSLGVHRSHRRNGIGSLLLDALMNHLTTAERHSVKAIFLHTLTTNQPAIFFYEKRRYSYSYSYSGFLACHWSINPRLCSRFTLHSFLPYYYNIRGKGKDGFTYVNYINGGHPPWTLLYPFAKYQNWLAGFAFVFMISLYFWLPS